MNPISSHYIFQYNFIGEVRQRDDLLVTIDTMTIMGILKQVLLIATGIELQTAIISNLQLRNLYCLDTLYLNCDLNLQCTSPNMSSTGALPHRVDLAWLKNDTKGEVLQLLTPTIVEERPCQINIFFCRGKIG